MEVATLLALRRAVRNGSVWIEHSLSFRGRQRLFLPEERWQAEGRRHYARLQLPAKASEFLVPLLARVLVGVDAVAAAARSGDLRVDDELHPVSLVAEEEDPQVTRLRSQLDQRIGEVQLPEVILAVDAQVRFSWIMLGREPRTGQELLMVYAGILAHGTNLTAAECARMIPQLSATSIRQAMRWADDERRLAQLARRCWNSCSATRSRQPGAEPIWLPRTSLATSRRVWQARQDPRRQTASIGVYSHVRQVERLARRYRRRRRGLGRLVSRKRSRPSNHQLAVGVADQAIAIVRERYADFGPPEGRDLVNQHCMEPTVYAQIEEKIFYPALREAIKDTDLLDEAEVEHASAKDLIAQIQHAAEVDDKFDAKVTVLGEYIDHHVKMDSRLRFPTTATAAPSGLIVTNGQLDRQKNPPCLLPFDVVTLKLPRR